MQLILKNYSLFFTFAGTVKYEINYPIPESFRTDSSCRHLSIPITSERKRKGGEQVHELYWCKWAQIIKFRYMNQSLQKYSEAELRNQLKREKLPDTTLYYSLVKKAGKNISFLTNDRLLIYDTARRMLYYSNDFKNTPFRTAAPEPKNGQFTPLQHSVFKNPSGTNELQVRYTGKNAKEEMETIEWVFACETQQLAAEWMKLIDEEKNRLMALLTGERGGAFIHDTLLDALTRNKQEEGAPKETILKPEEQVINVQPLQEKQDNVLNSRFSKKEDSLRKSELRNTNNNLQFSNFRENSAIRNTRNNQSRLIVEPNQPSRIEASSIKEKDPSIFRERDPSIIRQREPSQLREKDPSIVKPREASLISQASEKKNPRDTAADWNFKFLRSSSEATLAQFHQAALSAFHAIWEQDCAALSTSQRYYQSEGLLVAACNLFSDEGKLLKREFRNYHFVLQSCKDKWIVGVPLTCLIEWQGVIALVKAPLPQQCQQLELSEALPDIRELERYTRVSNSVLEKCRLIDATEVYGATSEKRLIYLDTLTEYLPSNVLDGDSKSTLRPQYMLDSVGQLTPGGDVRPSSKQEFKILSTVCEGVQGCVKELAEYLTAQEVLWADALQLKDIFHSYGVNLKSLPAVYTEVSNKQVKKYMMTVMAAKVAKDLANKVCLQARCDKKGGGANKIYEGYISSILEGNSTSSEFWKDLAVRFKKHYGIPFSNSELVGGFFFNSLLKLLRISCDPTKINKEKRIFKDQGVLGSGFVVGVQPKSKIYHRFTSDFIDRIKYACREEKKDPQISADIVNTLQLDTNPLPLEYSQGAAEECILEYLSYYTPPRDIDSAAALQKLGIYASAFKEPPSAFIFKLTRNYLFWCMKKDKEQEFRRGMEKAIKMADYWLEDGHLFHCSLYELLSDYHAAQGNGEESVRIMKESLSRCLKVCGTQSKLAGSKYYELGERELKVGRKRDALQNFGKAKINMQSHHNQSIKYPQLLMRLAALHLNNGSLDATIQTALHALKEFQEYDRRSGSGGALTEGYKIKTFQVLSRAYEIGQRREQLREMAVVCGKRFNRSRSEWAFEQMLRICLAAVIFHALPEKCDILLKLVNDLLRQDPQEESSALKQLMSLSESMVVIERFINRFEVIDRVVSEGHSKRGYSQQSKDFLHICKLLGGCVGEDYIEGLVQQKQYE